MNTHFFRYIGSITQVTAVITTIALSGLTTQVVAASPSASTTTHSTTAKQKSNISCNPTPIKATYTITEYKNGKSASYPMVILRNKETIVYDYPDAKLADVWRLELKNHLGMSRYFHANKRAIDYNSSDLNNIGNQNKWQKLFHLMDVSGQKPAATHKKGCFTTAVYDDAQKRVIYLPEYELPQSIYVFSDNSKKMLSKRFVLTQIAQSNQVNDTLLAYTDYDAMDFADIGDNEADPFISKMINMGFIEHEEHSHSGEQSHDSHKGHSH